MRHRGLLCRKDGPIRALERGIDLPYQRCMYRFDNVRLVPINVSYSGVKKPAFPERIVSSPFFYKNCTDSSYVVADNISISTTEGQTVTTSTVLTTADNVTWSGNVGFNIEVLQFGGSVQRQVTYSTMLTDQTTTDFTTNKTLTQAINLTIPPKTLREVRLEKKLSTGYIDFVGTVSVDADVSLSYKIVNAPGSHGRPQMPFFSIGKLSDLVSPAARIQKLDGQVWNVEGQQVFRSDFETPVGGGIECNGAGRIEAQADAASLGGLLSSLDALKSQLNSSLETFVTVPLHRGQESRVETADVVSNLWVRAKSTSASVCQLQVSSNAGKRALAARPQEWTPWVSLAQHIGKINTLVDLSHTCGAAPEVELRYER